MVVWDGDPLELTTFADARLHPRRRGPHGQPPDAPARPLPHPPRRPAAGVQAAVGGAPRHVLSPVRRGVPGRLQPLRRLRGGPRRGGAVAGRPPGSRGTARDRPAQRGPGGPRDGEVAPAGCGNRLRRPGRGVAGPLRPRPARDRLQPHRRTRRDPGELGGRGGRPRAAARPRQRRAEADRRRGRRGRGRRGR